MKLRFYKRGRAVADRKAYIRAKRRKDWPESRRRWWRMLLGDWRPGFADLLKSRYTDKRIEDLMLTTKPFMALVAR